MLRLTPTSKKSSKGLRRAKKAPNGTELKIKDRDVLPKSKLLVYVHRSQIPPP